MRTQFSNVPATEKVVVDQRLCSGRRVAEQPRGAVAGTESDVPVTVVRELFGRHFGPEEDVVAVPDFVFLVRVVQQEMFLLSVPRTAVERPSHNEHGFIFPGRRAVVRVLD